MGEQVLIKGEESIWVPQLDLLAAADDMGVVVTLVDGRLDDRTMDSKLSIEIGVLRGSHLEEDPHRLPFQRLARSPSPLAVV